MLRIFKYTIPLKPDYLWVIDLPIGAKILTVKRQDGNGVLEGGSGVLWALVDADPGIKQETRTFYNAWTGQPITISMDELLYIGTFETEPLVWHIFEKIQKYQK